MTGPLQALAARYDRLAARGEAPTYGYSLEAISYSMVLSSDGSLIDIQPFIGFDGKKVGQKKLVPQSFKRPGTTPRSFFLWDKTSFVLGVAGHKSVKGAVILTPAQHAAFKALHEELLAETDDTGLTALLAFLRTWTPERFATPPFSADMLDTNLVFRLDGDVLLHDRSAARGIWASRLGSADAAEGMCLVTGMTGPTARLHPAIKGVMGAQSSGASLVSFNLDAFTSYGKEQGANAPVSEAAAFGYGTVLNGLLAKGSRNLVRIGDATTVFWADAPKAEAIVRGLFDPRPPDDESEAVLVRDVLAEMAKGRPIEQAAPEVDPATWFYVLGLSPNAARLSIRFWHETTLGELARRFQEHWQDLRLEPPPDWGAQRPALWRLLYELAPQGKTENVPAHLAGELTRSILTGRRYPRSLLAAVIMRMRADQVINGLRAAICKAVLARELRLDHTSSAEDYLVSLDRDNIDPAYRLGRLFAVLERVQMAALGNVNATIRDRYYGSASTTPRSVFPILLRGKNAHVATLRKGRGSSKLRTSEAAGKWAEAEIEQIIDGLDGNEAGFPRHLSLDQQGRFAIGYYHQKAYRKGPADQLAAAETDSTNATDDSAED